MDLRSFGLNCKEKWPGSATPYPGWLTDSLAGAIDVFTSSAGSACMALASSSRPTQS